jgi:DNA repair protein RadC
MKLSFMLKVLRVGEPQRSMRIGRAQHAIKYWKSVISQQGWFDESKESLVALLLDVKYHIEGYSLVSIGTLDESIAHPRDIFRAAIAFGAHAVIVAHNHPSGNASPSRTDRNLFDRLNEAGDLLAIPVLDHIIVGKKRDYYSFREEAEAIEEKKAAVRRRRQRRRRRRKQLRRRVG